MAQLFIGPSCLGDAVITTGLLERMLADFPDSPITIACGPVGALVLGMTPRLERLHVMRKRGVEASRRFEQVAHDLRFLLAGHASLADREMRGQRGQHGQLAGKGLGGSDPDLRPCMGRQQQVGLARH